MLKHAFALASLAIGAATGTMTDTSSPSIPDPSNLAAHTEAKTAPEGAPESAPESAPEGWRLVWADEFDGDAIDLSKWNYDIDCWGGGNEEKQCYTDRPHNSFVKDGALTIRAIKQRIRGPKWPLSQLRGKSEEEANATAVQPYSSARLNTRGKGDWTFGRFEIRAKLPQGQGTWPAIWMLPTDEVYGSWALSGEIDIMEVHNLGASCKKCPGGRENTLYGTLHFGDAWPKNVYKGKKTVLEDTTGFNTYAVEWDAKSIRWFLNGEEYGKLRASDWKTANKKGRRKRSAPFDQRFHMILNLAVGGHLSEESNDKGVDASIFPQDLVIDYVRVYERAE